MQTFYSALVAAVLAGGAEALCDDTRNYCGRFTEWEDSVSATGPSYEWRFYNNRAADGQRTRSFRFINDIDGATPIAEQGVNGPVLFVSPLTVYCKEWFDFTKSDLFTSIPHQLFEAGYDVWISCRRGEPPSRNRKDLVAADGSNISPVDDADIYWDYNNDTVGELDIPSYVANILNSRKREGLDCDKVQIIASSTGATEVLTTLAKFPTSTDQWIGHVINLAPCPIGAPQNPNDQRRRFLEEKEMDLSNRQLSTDFFKDLTVDGTERRGRTMKRRKSKKDVKNQLAILGHSGGGSKSSKSSKSSKQSSVKTNKLPAGFIGRIDGELPIGETSALWDDYVANHSTHEHFWFDIGRSCAENVGGDPAKDCNDFCDWYPTLCAEFELRFPEYADPPQPAEIEAVCNIFQGAFANGIYSFYGDNFENDVATLCADPNFYANSCLFLQGKLFNISMGAMYMETSIQQLFHQFQNSWLQEFAEFNPNFCEDGWFEDTIVSTYDVTAITVPMTNMYIVDDQSCPEGTNQDLLNTVPTQRYGQFFTDPTLSHINIMGANDNEVFMTTLFDALRAGKNQPANDGGICRGYNTFTY